MPAVPGKKFASDARRRNKKGLYRLRGRQESADLQALLTTAGILEWIALPFVNFGHVMLTDLGANGDAGHPEAISPCIFAH